MVKEKHTTKKRRIGDASRERSSSWHELGEEGGMTCFLTDDTLLYILRRLPTRYLLSCVALVCRRWSRLCQTHLVYELVPPLFGTPKKPLGSLTEQGILELTKRHASTLKAVELWGLKQLNSKAIEVMCAGLPHLQHLALVSCPLLGSMDLENIVHQLPRQLSTLDLHMDHLISPLYHDRLVRQPLILDGVLSLLQQRCSNLQKLDLDLSSLITGPALDRLLLAFPTLTSLHLHCPLLGWPEVVRILQGCISLHHFSLCSPLLLQDPSSSDYSVVSERTATFSERTVAVDMPHSLVSLRLYSAHHRSVPWVSSPSLDLLRIRGKQLRHLHAQTSFNTSWHVISLWCLNLTCLDLSHSQNVTLNLTEAEEAVLCTLVQSLVKLEQVALPAVTDRILVQLSCYCPNLLEVRFQGHKARTPGTSLQAQVSVTDRGVCALAEGCPALCVLSLAGCHKVTISSARALAFHCRGLQVLELTGCLSWTDTAVTVLLPRLGRSLLFLDVKDCPQITHASIVALIQSIQAKGTSLRVLAISPTLYHSARSNLMQLQILAPSLQIRKGFSGFQWDGFYHSRSLHHY